MTEKKVTIIPSSANTAIGAGMQRAGVPFNRKERELWEHERWRQGVLKYDLANPDKPGRNIYLGPDPNIADIVFVNDTGMTPEKWAKLTSEERTYVPLRLRPKGWDPGSW